jgi:predicted nucleic acid-binding protein
MPTKFVIDTNVAISANGRDGKGEPAQASLECQLICSKWLANCKNIHIALDDADLIMSEYKRHLNYAAMPFGNAFFKHLNDYQHDRNKIQKFPITPIEDDNRGFAELPENEVDPSDRKFLAVAVVAKADIVNATDSDWTEQKALLDSLQIGVKQLCPEHSCKEASP